MRSGQKQKSSAKAGGSTRSGMRSGRSVKERIVDFSLGAFATDGYAATSLQDIVDGAGCSKGAFYYWFDTKDDVLFEIIDGALDEWIESARVRAEDGSPPYQRLAEHVVAIIDGVLQRRETAAIFLEQSRYLSEEHATQINEKRRMLEHLLARMIADGIAAGEIQERYDPLIAARAVLGLANSTYRWLRDDGKLPTRDVGRMYADLVLFGLSAGTTERSGAGLSDPG